MFKMLLKSIKLVALLTIGAVGGYVVGHKIGEKIEEMID